MEPVEDRLKIKCTWNRIFSGAGLWLADYFIYKIIDLDTFSEESVIMIILEAIFFLLILAGGYLILSGSNKNYKVDRNGITAHEKSARLFTPWEECAYIGIEKDHLILKKIVCIRKKGGYALKLPYSRKLWEGIHEFAPEGISSNAAGKENGTVYPQKWPFILKETEGEMTIDDSQKYIEAQKGELGMALLFGSVVIVFFIIMFGFDHKSSVWFGLLMLLLMVVIWLAEYQERIVYMRKIIISREGITIIDKHRQTFNEWQEFDKIGVVCRAEGRSGIYSFWIFCSDREKKLNRRRIEMKYTPKRYEQFLTYVPEGALTHPPTQEFEIEWLKNGNKGKFYGR